MKTSAQLVSSTARIWSGVSGRSSITVHETANRSVGADAAAHARLQAGGNVRTASWHWQVDDVEAVQSYAHTARCWHAGWAARDSIGIEICVNADGDYRKAVQNAAELVRRIMRQEGIPLSRVVQHNHWTGKHCPTILRDGSRGITWSQFLEMVRDGEDTPAPKPIVPARLAVDGVWGEGTTAKLQRVLGLKNIDGTVARQHLGWRSRNTGLASGWQWNGQSGDGGDPVIAEMQRRLKVTPDGKVGPKTIRALKRHLGLPATRGSLLRGGLAIKRLQKRLNRGEF